MFAIAMGAQETSISGPELRASHMMGYHEGCAPRARGRVRLEGRCKRGPCSLSLCSGPKATGACSVQSGICTCSLLSL